ncbi:MULTISPECIES: hypothetical protein [unclassified Agarivorans]|uniref:hypothetical protein n=1 Tax=unclassified Agarivorans TaxID=2636026 RepID=UPI0026E14901|nr:MULTISPECIES: hypothetical protein [unclassified Agarivorans]MDO6683961.1 hypothetical protein [Agarivorans sp. 3_MG-2023]MDO6714306.1 hypothetical protein [Agarivorans sp. 2_MG-2023]
MNNTRLNTGIALVAIAIALPFIAVPIITASPLSTAVKATAITFAVAGLPEIMLFFAGIIMGKDNLKALLSKLITSLKLGFAKLLAWFGHPPAKPTQETIKKVT